MQFQVAACIVKVSLLASTHTHRHTHARIHILEDLERPRTNDAQCSPATYLRIEPSFVANTHTLAYRCTFNWD